jgi:hypothetical protein
MFTWQTLLTVCLFASIDFVVLVRVRLGAGSRRQPTHRATRSEDFAVLVPIFNDIKYLRNAQYLARYGEKVVICTSDQESPEFYESLYREARLRGFQVSVSPTSSLRQRTNPFAVLSRALVQRNSSAVTHRDEIVRNSASSVSAGVTIFLDGDTECSEDLAVVAGAFESSGFDVASVRVMPSTRLRTLAQRMQRYEYSLAMDARWIYPWLTSGAAMIGRSSSMLRIMSSHSLFFSGGDIEVGKLARLMGMKVGHLPFQFFTDVPDTLRKWFRQRANGWCLGQFRHAVVNADRPGLRAPFFCFYQTLVVYVLLPFRWYETLRQPAILLLVWLVYSVFLFLFSPRTFQLWKLLFPIYAFVQVMFAVPIGIVRYVSHSMRTRNWGRIRVRPEPEIPVTTLFPAVVADQATTPTMVQAAAFATVPAYANSDDDIWRELESVVASGVDLPSPLEGTPERHFVGVLEVTTDRETAGDAGDPDA